FGVVDRLQPLRAKRSSRVVAGRGLDADHLAVRRERTRRDRRSRQQSAAAARDEQVVERADVFDQLARRRALACDDVRVTGGRDERQGTLAREPVADLLTVLAIA